MVWVEALVLVCSRTSRGPCADGGRVALGGLESPAVSLRRFGRGVGEGGGAGGRWLRLNG